LRWHFIGRLQANKVRAVVRAFPVIHSIDSQALAERTSRIALEEKKVRRFFSRSNFATTRRRVAGSRMACGRFGQSCSHCRA
jgi:uncharacterized pyridoxal phosphate-containing UPF0001 family protein